MTRDLRPVGALEMMDRAVLIVRRGGLGFFMRGIGAGLPVAAMVLLIYYLERVEGVRSVRSVLAMGLILAWWARAYMLSRQSRVATKMLWDGADRQTAAPEGLAIVRVASVVALGLWCWLWVLVAASLLGPLAVVLVLPLLAIRGAVAPSWLARAGAIGDAGFRGFLRSVVDTGNRRVTTFLLELTMLLAALGVLINLLVGISVVMLLSHSMLGLDVAFIDAFLSPSNVFTLLIVGCVTLLLFEPIRAASSAVVYVDGQVRQEGLDLRAAIDEAIAVSEARGRGATGRSAGNAAIVLLVMAIFTAAWARSAQAQPTDPRPAVGGSDPSAQIGDASDDDNIRGQVREILAGSEYDEFADNRGEGLRRFFSKLWADFWRRLSEEPEIDDAGAGSLGPAVPMPPASAFIVAAVIFAVLVLAYLWASRARDKHEASGTIQPVAGADGDDPRDRPPAAHLDDAALLARAGRFREALRALYLATLVSLDRRRLIAFDPALTNWQYLRHMPRDELRQDFMHFTRLFDYKWYGDERTTEADYETCRQLADRICATQDGP